MKLPETKEEEIDFLHNCANYIKISLDADLKLKDKYNQIYKLTKDKKQKEEYKKKIEDNDKEISYYQEKLDNIYRRLDNIDKGINSWD